jgi:hypothetical protein
MFEKVENIKRPLRKGERLLVPCLVKEYFDTIYITPIINHPHNDRENGQEEIHYHTDYRFVKFDKNGAIKREHSRHCFADEFRPQPIINGDLEYFILPVINEIFFGATAVGLIKKSKLKHKCIHKGKCPHRGYDLSQVRPDEDGIITCPLHGLKFNAETGELLNK